MIDWLSHEVCNSSPSCATFREQHFTVIVISVHSLVVKGALSTRIEPQFQNYM